MDYPLQILPSPEKKHIDCEIKKCVLCRNTDESNISEIWDKDLQQITAIHLADPTTHIYDLSTNLLDVFELKHSNIALTEKGKSTYNYLCNPDDEIVPPPTYLTDFELNDDHGLIYAVIEDVIDLKAEYVNVNDPITTYYGVSYVAHTPMKWNYWHFSIDWKITKKIEGSEDFEIVSREEISKNMRRKLGANARAELSKRFRVICPSIVSLPASCYTV